MSKPPLAAAAAVALSCMLVSAGRAVTIDFSTDGAGNSLSPGTVIANQYASIGVTFIGSAFGDASDPANPFATNTDMKLAVAGGDVPPGAVIPSGAGNFLHAYSGWTLEDGESNFAMLFDNRINTFSMVIYDDRVGLTQLFAIDGDNLVGLSQAVTDINANPQTVSVTVAAGFDAVGIVLGSNVDWVGVDNLSFTYVPEPGSLLASGALGALALRRKH